MLSNVNESRSNCLIMLILVSTKTRHQLLKIFDGYKVTVLYSIWKKFLKGNVVRTGEYFRKKNKQTTHKQV